MSAFIIVLSILTIILIYVSIYSVPHGMEYIVQRSGRYTRTLKPGFNFVLPFFDKITHRISMLQQSLDIPLEQFTTHDKFIMEIDGIVFYQVFDAIKVATKLGSDTKDHRLVVLNLLMSNIQALIGSMDLDELLLSNKEIISEELFTHLNNETMPCGIKIVSLNIQHINRHD